MENDTWSDMDQYIDGKIVLSDRLLQDTLKAQNESGFPSINVTAPQGMFLHLMAKICNARRILEFGTLAGYSTIWLGRALPEDGQLITLELDPEHARLSGKNIHEAGLSEKVKIVLGDASESLDRMIESGVQPFDLIFIDADKASLPNYFERAARVSRKGTVIIVDNVVRNGKVLDSESDDPSVLGVRNLFEMVGGNRRIESTVIQTVGSKGYDGFLLGVVNGDL